MEDKTECEVLFLQPSVKFQKFCLRCYGDDPRAQQSWEGKCLRAFAPHF